MLSFLSHHRGIKTWLLLNLLLWKTFFPQLARVSSDIAFASPSPVSGDRGLVNLPETFGSPIRVGLVEIGSIGNRRQRLVFSLPQGGILERVSTQERVKTLAPGSRLAFLVLQRSRVALEGTPYSDSEGFRVLPPREGGVEIGRSYYPGWVEVLLQPGGSLQVINEVPREDYVAGVLRAEGSPKIAREANRALSVCIRTYAEYNRGRHKEQGFDLCNTTHCQGYRGLTQGVQPYSAEDWAGQIAASTQGEVLTYEGQLIPTAYSTDCGGLLASNLNAGFGQSPWPFLSIGRDSDGKRDFCEKSPVHQWRLQLSQEQLEKALKKELPQIGSLESLHLVYETTGGRVQKVQLWGKPPSPHLRREDTKAKGNSEKTNLSLAQKDSSSSNQENPILLAELPAYRFRALLGWNTLRSTFFTVARKPSGEFEFTGRGWGHGVGLCLWGAQGMALSSYAYVEILAHYFPKGHLLKVSDQGWVMIPPGQKILVSQ